MKQYDDLSGDWQGLDSGSQSARYAAIAEMLRKWGVDDIVLDVGCGEAVLRRWLPRKSRYTGLEPSSLAASRAKRAVPSATIIHATAESFHSEFDKYDCVIFNEMLYYTSNPVGLIQKYTSVLTSRGVILCSIFQKKDGFALKRALQRLFDSRRPVSNQHCYSMVRSFMERAAWRILEDRDVPVPGASTHWRIWVASPPTQPGVPPRSTAASSC